VNFLDVLYIPLAAATAPLWIGKKRAGWPERFGHADPVPSVIGRPRLLIHAVSVGEISALRSLVPLLTPHCDLVLTATTDTGLARAQSLFGSLAAVRRYPLDFSWSVNRFLDAIRPDAVGLMELEVWPNFVRACSRRAIPVGVINGRLSDRSFRGYQRFRPLISPSFRRLAFASVQDATYAGRFRELGASDPQIHVTGSMKWDAAQIADVADGADELARDLGIDRSRPLVVAGSTGPLDVSGAPIGYDGRSGRPPWCEESLFHASCPPGVQLLCAPRKPERFEEAARALPGCVRRSRKGIGPVRSGSDRFLLDSIGELRAAYSLATVAIVGRSFGRLFGSDPIEPVALGKATLIGPNHGDFVGTVGPLSASGGLRVVSGEALPQNLADLLRSPVKRADMARAGRECIRREMGASGKNAALLRRLTEDVPRPTEPMLY